MTTNFSRGKGKLYDESAQKQLATVSYQLYEELAPDGSIEKWGGDAIFSTSIKPDERDIFILELEDGRRGQCYLKKKINKVVNVPSHPYFYCQGMGKLK